MHLLRLGDLHIGAREVPVNWEAGIVNAVPIVEPLHLWFALNQITPAAYAGGVEQQNRKAA
jgi:hypothetical protein